MILKTLCSPTIPRAPRLASLSRTLPITSVAYPRGPRAGEPPGAADETACLLTGENP